VGFAARQAGVTIEQLEGYTTSMASSLGLRGSEIGTAIKSFISRLYRIGPEGEEDAGKAEATLDKLGIAVRDKLTGEFRKFDDILTEIRGKWADWGNVTKLNVAQVMGGKCVPQYAVMYI
jgi:TP901 family phage tail tape measure protein